MSEHIRANLPRCYEKYRPKHPIESIGSLNSIPPQLEFVAARGAFSSVPVGVRQCAGMGHVTFGKTIGLLPMPWPHNSQSRSSRRAIPKFGGWGAHLHSRSHPHAQNCTRRTQDRFPNEPICRRYALETKPFTRVTKATKDPPARRATWWGGPPWSAHRR